MSISKILNFNLFLDLYLTQSKHLILKEKSIDPSYSFFEQQKNSTYILHYQRSPQQRVL